MGYRQAQMDVETSSNFQRGYGGSCAMTKVCSEGQRAPLQMEARTTEQHVQLDGSQNKAPTQHGRSGRI